jgi:RimJ/RimL family protein N-acetyltransferase
LLETERLLLRRPRLEDVDAVLEYISDPEVMQFIGGMGRGDRAEAQEAVERWIERWEANGFGQLSVVRRKDGRWVGRTGLLVWDRAVWFPSNLSEAAEPEIELGWTFARAHWGHGYATEAALAARRWAQDELGVERLISLIDPDNARSIRVAEKLGASPVETVDLDGHAAVVWLHPRAEGVTLTSR